MKGGFEGLGSMFGDSLGGIGKILDMTGLGDQMMGGE